MVGEENLAELEYVGARGGERGGGGGGGRGARDCYVDRQAASLTSISMSMSMSMSTKHEA